LRSIDFTRLVDMKTGASQRGGWNDALAKKSLNVEEIT
jgi:hypothetical protein